jgi:hypothetical protein
MWYGSAATPIELFGPTRYQWDQGFFQQEIQKRVQTSLAGGSSLSEASMFVCSVSSREWQPLLVANSGTAMLYMSAFASLCKRQPTIIQSVRSVAASSAAADQWQRCNACCLLFTLLGSVCQGIPSEASVCLSPLSALSESTVQHVVWG